MMEKKMKYKIEFNDNEVQSLVIKEKIRDFVSKNLDEKNFYNATDILVIMYRGRIPTNDLSNVLRIIYRNEYYVECIFEDYSFVAKIIPVMESKSNEPNKNMDTDEIFKYAVRLVHELTIDQLNEIFGFDGIVAEIITHFTFSEICERIDEFDQKKKIEIGDIVISTCKDAHEFMVTFVNDKVVHGISINDGTVRSAGIEHVAKTNKSCTFEELFNRLKNEELFNQLKKIYGNSDN